MSPSTYESPPEPSEDTPLIQQNPSCSRTPSRSKDGLRFSPATLVIPIAIISRLAVLLTATTTLRILQKISCLLYYYLNDPRCIPPAGGIPDELCMTPGVNSYYAAIISIGAVSDGIGIVLACSAASYFGSRLGRKPTLLGVFVVSIIGRGLLVLAQNIDNWVQLPLFALWIFSESITNPVSVMFIFSLYIVDVAEATERTAALSKITGWSTLGGALSFSLGGWITAQINNLTGVYIISIAVHALTCIYILAVLPESFSLTKREELHRQREEEARSTLSRGWARKILSSLAVVSEPLKQLKPNYDLSTGRQNWRLVYCAIHIFIVAVADGYATLAMVIYFTSRYQYTPAETGYVFTILYVTSVVVLTFVVPVIVHRLRPFYVRKQPIVVPEELTSGSSNSVKNEDLEVSDRLDVHVTVGSWVIESLAYIAIGFMNTIGSQLAAVVGIGFGAGRIPVFRSLVAASVDPLKQGELGEALAAIEMVSSIGMILSPIVMGSITTSTINTIPQMVFYVHAAIILVGALVLFFIRDSDRFQKPAVVFESEG